MRDDTVVIAPCGNYEIAAVKEALRSAIGSLNGFDSIRRGMRIGIKANLVAAGAPNTAMTTHPVVVTALTELLIERGASVVVGDSAGGPWTLPYMNRIYSVSGMQSAEAAGGELNRDFAEGDASFPEAVKARSFRYTVWLDGCDAIINV